MIGNRNQTSKTATMVKSKPRVSGGLMGSAPGAMQQISVGEVRKLRQEIQNLRDANDDLKDELHEARQNYLLVKSDRDTLKFQLAKNSKDMANIDALV